MRMSFFLSVWLFATCVAGFSLVAETTSRPATSPATTQAATPSTTQSATKPTTVATSHPTTYPTSHPITAQAATQPATIPADIRRVLFLGDSITYGGLYCAYFEAYFATRHPTQELIFINVGLSSETVSGLSEPNHAAGKFPRPDLHERLDRILNLTKPDLVFACYGMNDGIYLPLDSARFGKFKDGMNWLHKKVTDQKARIIHLTPPSYDTDRTQKDAFYNGVLDEYSKWLLDQRAEQGWEVADIHGPMNKTLADGKAKDPKFFLSGDGVHPGDVGHWLIAQQVLLYLGGNDIASTPDARNMISVHPKGAEIMILVKERQSLMKDAWLSATGHKRPGVKPGLPMDEAEKMNQDLLRRIRQLAKSAN